MRQRGRSGRLGEAAEPGERLESWRGTPALAVPHLFAPVVRVTFARAERGTSEGSP